MNGAGKSETATDQKCFASFCFLPILLWCGRLNEGEHVKQTPIPKKKNCAKKRIAA